MDRKWSRWSYRWCSQLDHHSYRPTLACRPPLLPKEQYQNVHSLECKGRRGILPIAWFSVLRLHKVRSSLLLGFLKCMLPFCRGSIHAWTRGWSLACFIYRKMLAHLLSSFKCSTFSLIRSSNPPAKISLDAFFASESFVVRNRAYARSAKLRFFFLSKRLMERKDLLMWISDNYLSIICRAHENAMYSRSSCFERHISYFEGMADRFKVVLFSKEGVLYETKWENISEKLLLLYNLSTNGRIQYCRMQTDAV